MTSVCKNGGEEAVWLCETIRTHVPHICTLHRKLDPAVDNTLTLACMTTLPVTFCEKVKASIVVVCQHTHCVAPASSITITFTSVIH